MKRIAACLACSFAALALYSAATAAPRGPVTNIGCATAEEIVLIPTDGTGGHARLTLEHGRIVARVSDPAGEIVAVKVLAELPATPAKLADPEAVQP